MRHHMTGRSVLPRPRAEGLLVERVGDETVVYDVGTKEAHCLKPLAALVFGAGDGTTTVEQAAHRAGVEPEAVIDAVGQLQQLGLLDVPLVVLEHEGSRVSRRDMLRKAGYAGAAAAAAAPLITSIAAPTPAGAQVGNNGIPNGCSHCANNADCVGDCCEASTSGSFACRTGCCVPSLNTCRFCNCDFGDFPFQCDCAVAASSITGGCPTCPSGHASCCRTSTSGCL